jgi:peptide/nickel transport system permease protein
VISSSAARLTDPENQFATPGLDHLLGTDQAGRDVFARAVYAAQTSLLAALFAAAVAMLLGIGVGGVAGAATRWFDWLLMRGTDVLLAFPGLLLALTITALLDAGIWQAAVAVGIALSPVAARLVRAAVLEVTTRQYVEAARSFGAGPVWIARVHLLPAISSQLIAFATVILAYSLLNLAGLDFLGVTGDPTLPTWGHMLADGRAYLGLAPWIALTPGLMLTLTVMAAIGLGDSLTRLRGT